MDLFPYVVQQGDHLLALAARYGFDADLVWQDKANEALRKQGRDPNILLPCDVLYLPEPKKKWLPIKVGAANAFVAKVPGIPVQFALAQNGKPLAGEACIVHLAPDQSVTADGSGVLSFKVPATMRQVAVSIPRLALVRTFKIGHLDPVSEDSGIRQRLKNLGFGPKDPAGLTDGVIFTRALARFQTAQGLPPSGQVDDATRAALAKAHGC